MVIILYKMINILIIIQMSIKRNLIILGTLNVFVFENNKINIKHVFL